MQRDGLTGLSFLY